jgi:tetratricopeptide (TPR) repeat protein
METALALAPQDSGLLLATAASEMACGAFEQALAHAQSANLTAAREALVGDIQEGLGSVRAAVDAYKHAIELAPDEERYRVALALERIKHAEFDIADAELSEAHRSLPNSYRISTLLAISQYGAGYSDEAILGLNEAIDAGAKTHAIEPILARIVLQSSAVPSSRTSKQLCAWNTTVCAALDLRRARVSVDKALLAEAISSLQRAPEADPVRACELGRAYEWEQRLMDARRELEKCVRLDGSPQNHYRLGLLYGRMGLKDLASQQMARRAELLKSMSEETALARSALTQAEVEKQ